MCVAVKDDRHQHIFGSVVLQKGVEELWAVERVVRCIESLGDREVTLKSDTEPVVTGAEHRSQQRAP